MALDKSIFEPDTNYGVEQMKILEGIEAVRMRPGMYIGTTSSRGLHHLVYEVVDNSIDEAMAGYCSKIEVIIHVDNSITVKDNGRGIPVDIHPEYNKSGLEIALTVLHGGGKFSNSVYKVSGGLHGVGVTVVNALSEWMKAEVCIEGKKYFQEFTRAIPVAPLKKIGTYKGDSGTTIIFKPDSEIFEETIFDYEILSERLMELSFLNKDVTITIIDERSNKKEVYRNSGGVSDFVKYLNHNKDIIHKPVYIEKVHHRTKEDEETTELIHVEMALQYNTGYIEILQSYVNNIHTQEGGTHEAGFKAAMTSVINDYARKSGILKEKDNNFTGDDVREGLAVVLSVKVPEPQFEGQTKTKLGNSYVQPIVNGAVREGLTEFFEENPATAKKITDKALQASRARIAARKARELIRGKNKLEGNSLPGKLADCSWKNAEYCELFLVEGDSAGGSAKSGRDNRYQAILPLRGKILNVEKARLDKILGNEEIRSMITAMGTGISDNFALDKARYHKIVIMTDADVDGAHIRTLLLTFFYRFMTPLIREGYVYIAQPPLFKIEKNKDVQYAYSDKELERILNQVGRDRCSIQRYKGLGEMNADQLWETTMNPESRTILQVRMEHALQAEEYFTILMGDKVEPRRNFIQSNAASVKNLDI